MKIHISLGQMLLHDDDERRKSVGLKERFMTIATEIIATKTEETDTDVWNAKRVFKRFVREWKLDTELRNSLKKQKRHEVAGAQQG